MGGICKRLECYPVKIGGYTNHVHILCTLSKKIMLISLLEEVKKSSSKWLKTKGSEFSDFHWQDGYGAFSVNAKGIEAVSEYIMNQEKHHKKVTFEDEYRLFLKEFQVDYDERYVWD